jgi:serine protease AprX
MKKKYFLFLLVFSFTSFSQEDAWVYFTDKPNAQYFFDNPLEMLSQRSIDRRMQQNISIDIRDVPVYQAYIDQVSVSPGIIVKAKSKWMNCLHVRGSQNEINALLIYPFVSHVTFANRLLNQANKTSATNSLKPVNKQLAVQTNFNYGNSNVQIAMLNGHLLHQQNFTGAGKIIAVMDAGFPNVDVLPVFQRLRDNNLILGGYNYVDGNSNIYSNNPHGTMVLSTMGGFEDNQLIGTAPDAAYYLFITEDTNSENPVEESYWVEAAEQADRLGVDVINTSLGYFTYDNSNYNYSYQDMNGVTSFIAKGANIAFSRGMICVTSAGNSGNSSVPTISTPADGLHTLTVGAVAFDESYASFSSIGPTFDNRIKPDVMAQGQNPFVSTVSGVIINGASGTSFSSPIMAGMVASFWQAIPWATNQQIIQFVKQSADRYSSPTNQFGYGIPDFQLALSLSQLSLNNSKFSEIVLYPNPTTGTVSVSFPDNEDELFIKITNTLGQIIFEKKIHKGLPVISLENQTSGMYFYSVQSKNSNKAGRIIKK